MAQFSTSTCFNRYPDIFRTVQARVAEKCGPNLGGETLKILSYGCSTGAELMSLRCYFPDAMLFGCDVDPGALQSAIRLNQERNIAVFPSTPSLLEAAGPFDVIFAMSVLCRWGLSRRANRLDHIYPFECFASDVSSLARNASENGILVIYNANYLFRDTPASEAYKPVGSNLISSNGFVDKWNPSGARLSKSRESDRGWGHLVLATRDDLQDSDFIDCVFEKQSAEARLMHLGMPGPEAVRDKPVWQTQSGPDLVAAARERRVAARLDTKIYDGEDGRKLTRLQWSRSALNGKVYALEPYWTEAPLAMPDEVSAFKTLAADTLAQSFASAPRDRLRGSVRRARHGLEKVLAGWR